MWTRCSWDVLFRILFVVVAVVFTGCETVNINDKGLNEADTGNDTGAEIDTATAAEGDTASSADDDTESGPPDTGSNPPDTGSGPPDTGTGSRFEDTGTFEDSSSGTLEDAGTSSDVTDTSTDTAPGTEVDSETAADYSSDGDTETASQVDTGRGTGTENTTDITDTDSGTVLDTPTGAPDTDTAPADTDTGPADTGTGPADTGTGPADTDTGPADTGTGPADTGTGPADTGTGPADTDTGPADTGTGPADTGTGPTDTGTGPVDTDTGTSLDALIASGTLLHQWRFNGTLDDDIGGSNAVIVDPDDTPGGDAVLSSTDVTLVGGDNTEVEYVSLGSNLLSNIDGPLTIELFATHLSVHYFGRIFEFGGATDEYLIMLWVREMDENQDLVRWWDSEMVSVENTNAPYTLGEEFHIVMTVEPGGGADGAMRIAWYTAPSSDAILDDEKGSLETGDALADLDDSDCWLGKSHSSADPIAHASYNEVRIWSGVLSRDDLETLHTLGPSL